MTCSHPVIYTDSKGDYCHICKARLDAVTPATSQADKNPPETQKPPETAKAPAKQAGKKVTKKAAEEPTGNT